MRVKGQPAAVAADPTAPVALAKTLDLTGSSHDFLTSGDAVVDSVNLHVVNGGSMTSLDLVAAGLEGVCTTNTPAGSAGGVRIPIADLVSGWTAAKRYGLLLVAVRTTGLQTADDAAFSILGVNGTTWDAGTNSSNIRQRNTTKRRANAPAGNVDSTPGDEAEVLAAFLCGGSVELLSASTWDADMLTAETAAELFAFLTAQGNQHQFDAQTLTASAGETLSSLYLLSNSGTGVAPFTARWTAVYAFTIGAPTA